MIVIVFFASCGQEACRESIDAVPVVLKVERLEDELFNSRSVADVEKFLQDHHEFATYFLRIDQYPADSVLAGKIFRLMQNPSLDTLFRESLGAFRDFEEFISELKDGYSRLKSLYPETGIPLIQTAVTGLAEGGDLYITNDRVIIGLDFFIGEKATFKLGGIPNYIAKRYTREHLPSIILQFVSSQYVRSGGGESMLADMIDYGKNYYLLSKILPCTPERILIGYTDEEWDDIFENDDIIWANFVQNEWLYETNHAMKQKFLGERPNVYEIGDKCPGRIGAWLGWQIVKAYMRKVETSIEELRSEIDHNKIFTRSGYKPG